MHHMDTGVRGILCMRGDISTLLWCVVRGPRQSPTGASIYHPRSFRVTRDADLGTHL